MAQIYTLPTSERPTFWNIDAGVGFTIGSFFGLVGAPIGAIIGGFMGKTRMQNELENGIQTSEPTFWNKGILAGWTLGAMAALPLAFAGLILLNMPIAAYGGAALVGGAVGAVYGSLLRKNTLAERYETAKTFHENQSLGMGQAPSHQRSQEPPLVSEIAHETRGRGDGKTWASHVEGQGAANTLANSR